MKTFFQYINEMDEIIKPDDPRHNCPDCESFSDGKWRTGRCDTCHGLGRIDADEGCPDCDGTGSPACCRCKGTGVDKNL